MKLRPPRLTPAQYWSAFILLSVLVVAFLVPTMKMLMEGKSIPVPIQLFLTGTGGALAGLLFNKREEHPPRTQRTRKDDPPAG